MNCSKCKEQIVEEDRLPCSVCRKSFHYNCVGFLETNFRRMRKDTRERWKCIDCSNSGRKTDSQEKGAINSEKEEGNLRALFEEYTNKITNKMKDIEASIQFTANHHEDILKMMKEMKSNMEKLEARQVNLEKENAELKKMVSEMQITHEERYDSLENRSRISNIEIRNVPETQGEDVVQIVKEIGRVIGIPQPIAEGDIQVAHRVDQRNKERGNRPIIVHMSSRFLRNKWLMQFRALNKTGPRTRLTARMINQNLPDIPVYLNEHLTVHKKILLKDAKEVAKHANIKFVWVKDGYILMKKDEQDRSVKKINTRRELEELEKKVRSTFTV